MSRSEPGRVGLAKRFWPKYVSICALRVGRGRGEIGWWVGWEMQ